MQQMKHERMIRSKRRILEQKMKEEAEEEMLLFLTRLELTQEAQSEQERQVQTILP